VKSSQHQPAEFDQFTATYDRDLQQALSVTGESKEYYATTRVEFLRQCLASLNASADRILDFGCGIGSNCPILVEVLKAKHVVGIDVSKPSIDEATSLYGSPFITFNTAENFRPDGAMDLAFCNGVFHHIVPTERSAALAIVYGSLRKGGLFAFWENNPWNPGTKYVMSKCAFDENAITLTIPEAKRMLNRAGFTILRTDSLFYFPRSLAFLRPAERVLSRLPFGGQYHILCRKTG
jgi:SAM-dependent methyltransferase